MKRTAQPQRFPLKTLVRPFIINLGLLSLLTVAVVEPSLSQTLTIIHAFKKTDGWAPYGNLIRDAADNPCELSG